MDTRDGKADPTDLTSRLPGRADAGATIVEGVRVTGVDDGGRPRHRRRLEVGRREGTLVCETLVNCGGQWARAFGRLAGVAVPLYAAEHFYLVTKAIPGVAPDMPVVRDPDGYLYYKEEVGGLVMGGFEPKAKPWNIDPIPDGVRVPAAPRGLGPVRDPDEECDPPDALPETAKSSCC